MSDDDGRRRDDGTCWLDRPGSVAKVFWSVVAMSALLLVLDLFYEKHAELEMEHAFGFYGLYGFVCCVFLVIAARALRRLVKREEGYYDR